MVKACQHPKRRTLYETIPGSKVKTNVGSRCVECNDVWLDVEKLEAMNEER